MNSMRNKKIIGCIVVVYLIWISGCAARIAMPDQLKAPEPIHGNSGKYMSPYTSDGTLAEWTDKAINAKLGSAIGKNVGAYAGQKAVESIPFIGGFLGNMAGEAIGRKIAIEASGGWDYIKTTSDLSFDNPDDLSVYLYVKYSRHEHYNDALDALLEIYPEMKDSHTRALENASRNVL